MTPFSYSAFLARWTKRFDPDYAWLSSAGSLKPKNSQIHNDFKLLTELDTQSFDRECRLLRNRIQAGLIYRLLSGKDQFNDTVCITTCLAEAALEASINHHKRLLDHQFGKPADPRFSVIGMGKLGGLELNLSSDIDIFCIFGAEGETAGPRVREHSEYFRHLTQKMAKSLDQHTADGFVARVDQRLRPWGTAG